MKSTFYHANAAAISFITKPIKPTTAMPKALIFMDSHSSSLSGLDASFRVLAA